MLETIPNWYWEKEDPFDMKYNELKEWVETNQRIPIQNKQDSIEKSLAYFCSKQRSLYKNNMLSEDIITKLESIQLWCWSTNKFDNTYNKLKKWILDHKQLPSKKSHNTTEKKLGSFCSTRRHEYMIGKLAKSKIKKLEVLPDWFWSRANDTKVKKYSGSKRSR